MDLSKSSLYKKFTIVQNKYLTVFAIDNDKSMTVENIQIFQN